MLRVRTRLGFPSAFAGCDFITHCLCETVMGFSANLVIEFRWEHKEHRGLDAATRERTSQRLVRRAVRAPTPGEGEGAELPRQMRRRW